MLKLIMTLAIFSFFLSCDKEETRYLYNKYDPEYDVMVNAAKQECVNNSQFFSTYDNYDEFDSAPFNVGEIFKITVEDDVAIYVKVTAINPTDVELTFDSAEEKYQKVVTWEESDHQELGEFFKTAACSSSYDDYFTSIGGLNSTSNLSYKWYKETIIVADDDDSDSEPEAYKRQWDSLNVNLRYPTMLYYYNGTKELKKKLDENSDEVAVTKKLTIELMDSGDKECYPDSGDSASLGCDFASTGSFPTCTATVDEDAYKLRAYDTSPISLSGTNCELYEFN